MPDSAFRRRAYRAAKRIRDQINRIRGSSKIAIDTEYYDHYRRCIIHIQDVYTGKRTEQYYDLQKGDPCTA